MAAPLPTSERIVELHDRLLAHPRWPHDEPAADADDDSATPVRSRWEWRNLSPSRGHAVPSAQSGVTPGWTAWNEPGPAT